MKINKSAPEQIHFKLLIIILRRSCCGLIDPRFVWRRDRSSYPKKTNFILTDIKLSFSVKRKVYVGRRMHLIQLHQSITNAQSRMAIYVLSRFVYLHVFMHVECVCARVFAVYVRA